MLASFRLLMDGHGRRSFLGRRVPAWFRHRVVIIPAGEAIAYVESEWSGAIVSVEAGEVELEALDGERRTFGEGDLLWLAGVRLRALHSRGPGPARLIAIARRPVSADPDRRRP